MNTTLGVKGMKCGGCESTVRQAVQALDGVLAVRPDFRANAVEIEYEEGKADLDAIRQAIAAKGFQV